MSNDAAAVVGGLIFSAVGAIFAFNLGGFTKWHARVSYAAVSFLRYIPPWRWLVKADKETLIKRGVLQERITGGVFVALGLFMLISSVI